MAGPVLSSPYVRTVNIHCGLVNLVSAFGEIAMYLITCISTYFPFCFEGMPLVPAYCLHLNFLVRKFNF